MKSSHSLLVFGLIFGRTFVAFPARAQAPATPPVAPSTTPATTPAASSPDATVPDTNVQAVTDSYNAGVTALKAGNYEMAGESFEKTLALAPDDAMAHMLLGYVRLKQGRDEDALKSLETARKKGGKLDVRSRAIIENNIGMTHWHNKEYVRALPAYQAAVALDKTYNDARYNLAFALLSQNRAKEALPHFTQLAALNKRDPMLQDGLGQTYESLGDWTKAFASYEKAIALNAKDSSYVLNLGLAYVRSDPMGVDPLKRNKAIGFLRQATVLNPQGAPAFLQLGMLLIEKKRWSEAQETLRRYVALKPDDFSGLFNLALSYDYAGTKFDEALKTYALAEAISGKDPAVKNNIGRIYLKREKLDDAIANFHEALELDPNFVDARNNLALALAAKKDYAGSTVEWNKLIAQTNETLKTTIDKKLRASLLGRIVAARAALAENYLKDNAFADAAAEYRKLLALAPNNIPARSNLGLTLYKIKDYAEALQNYDEVLKREPNNAIAHNNRGAALEALNKRADALTAYQKAVELKPDYTQAKANRDRLLATTAVG